MEAPCTARYSVMLACKQPWSYYKWIMLLMMMNRGGCRRFSFFSVFLLGLQIVSLASKQKSDKIRFIIIIIIVICIIISDRWYVLSLAHHVQFSYSHHSLDVLFDNYLVDALIFYDLARASVRLLEFRKWRVNSVSHPWELLATHGQRVNSVLHPWKLLPTHGQRLTVCRIPGNCWKPTVRGLTVCRIRGNGWQPTGRGLTVCRIHGNCWKPTGRARARCRKYVFFVIIMILPVFTQ